MGVTPPSSALIDACASVRPSWDGMPVSLLYETLFLFTTLPVLGLLFVTAIAIWSRIRWVAFIASALWLFAISIMLTADLHDIRWEARTEGCIGSEALFLGLCAAICVGTLYLGIRLRRRPTAGDR